MVVYCNLGKGPSEPSKFHLCEELLFPECRELPSAREKTSVQRKLFYVTAPQLYVTPPQRILLLATCGFYAIVFRVWFCYFVFRARILQHSS